MNTASQVPSGVLIVTLISTTGRAAADAEPAAARPTATDTAMKSRRDRSVVASFNFSESSLLSVIISLLYVVESGGSDFNFIFAQKHMPAAFWCQAWINVGSTS